MQACPPASLHAYYVFFKQEYKKNIEFCSIVIVQFVLNYNILRNLF
jgi:hypothetical protein